MTVCFFRPILCGFAVLSLASLLGAPSKARPPQDVKPIRALLVTGGCCHDYTKQKQILSEAVSARAKVEWTLVQEGGSGTNHKLSVFENSDWTKKYDIVVHNECFADVNDMDFINGIVEGHKNGVAAVVVHCAMHTYRDIKSDVYREFLGVTTRSHGPQHPLDVKNLEPKHPIMKGFPSVWKTGNEELYAILKVWPGVTPLAKAFALDNKRDNAVIWVHEFGKTRVFGTTLAHNNATMSDPVYLDMFARGFLWAAGKLDDEGNPAPGYGPSAGKAE
jgi:type 1 glutamine amidotransferase